MIFSLLPAVSRVPFFSLCQLLTIILYIYVCSTSQLRPLGRSTKGVGAMRLEEGDKMAAMDVIPSTIHTMPEKSANR